MDEQEPKPQSKGPVVTLVIGIVLLLLGIGRCGFLEPAIKGTVREDYGIAGAFFIVLAILTFIVAAVWHSRARSRAEEDLLKRLK